MANKKSDISNAQKLGIGVGLTTAAVAAVGAYFLYGSKDASSTLQAAIRSMPKQNEAITTKRIVMRPNAVRNISS